MYVGLALLCSGNNPNLIRMVQEARTPVSQGYRNGAAGKENTHGVEAGAPRRGGVKEAAASWFQSTAALWAMGLMLMPRDFLRKAGNFSIISIDF